jgi:protoporphyrinogen oxidase
MLSDGTTLDCDIAVVATEQPAACKLLGLEEPSSSQATTCLYFSVSKPPTHEATLVLNGEAEGPINNLCFPSFAQSSYAPPGKHLASVSLRGDIEAAPDEILGATVNQLLQWFGPQVHEWTFLRSYRIKHALPSQTVESLRKPSDCHAIDKPSSFVRPGVYRCGDYCESASIEGAIRSGISVAEAVSSELG